MRALNTLSTILFFLVVSATAFSKNTLTIQLTKSDITCFGKKNGKVEVYINGGTAPYSILWTNGQTTNVIENLKKGSYAVTVTDAKGKKVTDSISVDMPQPLSVSFENSRLLPVDNFNSMMNIAINGGTPWINETTNPIYMVRLDNKSYYEHPENLENGVYQMTIEDASGCVLSFKTNITVQVAGEEVPVLDVNNGLGMIEMIVSPSPASNSQKRIFSQAN